LTPPRLKEAVLEASITRDPALVDSAVKEAVLETLITRGAALEALAVKEAVLEASAALP